MGIVFKLNSPLTKDDWNLITDAEFEHSDSVTFTTPSGKEVEFRKVVHGEWFPIDVGDCCYRCSVCNIVRDAYLLEEDNYCPHCGAKMERREDEHTD